MGTEELVGVLELDLPTSPVSEVEVGSTAVCEAVAVLRGGVEDCEETTETSVLAPLTTLNESRTRIPPP